MPLIIVPSDPSCITGPSSFKELKEFQSNFMYCEFKNFRFLKIVTSHLTVVSDVLALTESFLTTFFFFNQASSSNLVFLEILFFLVSLAYVII